MRAPYCLLPEYNSWRAMIARCYDPRNNRYEQYGGRGITVCQRWRRYANFLSDMGRKPSPRHSIERIDRDGNYESRNCRWATATEQARNKSNSRTVALNGELVPLIVAAEAMGVSYGTLHSKLSRNRRGH